MLIKSNRDIQKKKSNYIKPLIATLKSTDRNLTNLQIK